MHSQLTTRATAVGSARARAELLERFFHEQEEQDLLRFITAGSVDDGKSTLIGRLLWESEQLFDDQVAAVTAESRRYGTQGGALDLALLVDGLAAEREQGITIDVAHRFFATARRKFIVADSPGHEQYTRNMVTAASNADAAVLLVDASQGVLTQTRRHAFLASLMGIRSIALAVNKMDLVGFDSAVFRAVSDAFLDFARTLQFDAVTAIPVSALKGDNVVGRSRNTAWYTGPTLMGFLETVKPRQAPGERLVFPVQWVNRPDSAFRGFAGTLAEGSLAVGDEIRVTSSGHHARIAEIVTMDGTVDRASAGDAVTLRLDREIDVSRGDVISTANAPIDTTDQFEATLIWMHQDPGLAGRTYLVKSGPQWVPASLTGIKYRVDINTLVHEACRKLELNDIAVCNINCAKPLPYDTYENSRALGSFILVDRHTNATVAAGLIRHSLRRAQNVHRQPLTIARTDRERLSGHAGQVIWFTGLPASGKSTLANALEVELHRQGRRTYLLDGDNLRHGLNKDLGFTEGDRVENIRRVAEVAKLLVDAGIVVMASFVSPFRRDREMVRDLVGGEDFFEVYVSTPLEVCEQRDPKGLYRKARMGQIPNMTGINSPYEAPRHPDFVAGASTASMDATVRSLVEMIERRGRREVSPDNK